MDNIIEIQKEGYVIYKPKEGYIFYKDGEVHPQVILGVNSSINSFEIIQDINYEMVKLQEETDELLSIKKHRVEQSKVNLAVFLEQNPLFSTVKYQEGRYYNVTSLKQQQLTSTILIYQGCLQHGLEYELKWNDTGNICETWTYDELMMLSFEISSYVRPYIEMQQAMEVDIMRCKTEEEVLSIDINF